MRAFTGAVSRWTTLHVVGLGLLLSLCVAGTMAYAMHGARQEVWGRSIDASENLARALARELAAEVRAIDMTLLSVSETLSSTEVVELHPQVRREMIRDRIRAADFLDAVIFLDARGGVTFDSRQEVLRDQVNLAERDYFDAHVKNAHVGLFISSPFSSRRADSQWTIGFSRRLSGPNGAFAGVVLGVTRNAKLESSFDRMRIGQRGSLTFLRTDGVILARSPSNTALLGRRFDRSPVVVAARTAASGRLVETSLVDGVRRLFVFHRVEGAPIIVNVAVSLDDAFADWWRKVLLVGTATAFLAAALVALMLALRRELARRQAAEMEARASEATFRLLAEHGTDTVMRLDRAGRRTYVSPAAEALYGRSVAELLRRSVVDDIEPADLPIIEEAKARLLDDEETVRAEYRVMRPDGSVAWVESAAKIIRDSQSVDGGGAVVVTRDVTTRHATEQHLMELANTDALTGLANRRRFDQVLEDEWLRARRDGSTLSLVMVDVDHFKRYNDEHGHPAGDECLRQVAAAIVSAARRPTDLVARYGGEEIAAILPTTDLKGASMVAEAMRAAVERLGLPHAGNAPSGVVTVSLGVAACAPLPMEMTDTAGLLAAADAGLYSAKHAGRNRFCARPPVRQSAADGVAPAGA